MKKHSRFSRGQMIIIFTLVLPVLLGAMALGADFAIIFFNRIAVQKAADAAALAGASQLTGVAGSWSSVQPDAVEYADGYACLNGVNDPKSTSPTICPTPPTQPSGFVDQIVFVNGTDTSVSVGIRRTVPYFFGKMIGLQNASVAATATATVYHPVGGSGLLPIGVQCTAPCSNISNLAGGVTFGTKFLANVVDPYATGNWSWVNVGQGTGASDLKAALESGGSANASIGDPIPTVTGIKTGPASAGLAARLASCSAAAYNAANPTTPFKGNTTYDPCSNGGQVGGTAGIGGADAYPTGWAVPSTDPCLVTLPALDFTGCSGGSCSPALEGFVQVYLEQDSGFVSGPGGTSLHLDGCFVQGATDYNTVGGSGGPALGPISPPVLTN